MATPATILDPLLFKDEVRQSQEGRPLWCRPHSASNFGAHTHNFRGIETHSGSSPWHTSSKTPARVDEATVSASAWQAVRSGSRGPSSARYGPKATLRDR